MKLSHLISLRRCWRCIRVFRRPLGAHFRIAAARRRPLTLQLRRGGSLHVGDARAARGMFNWILEHSDDPLSTAIENSLVTFNHRGLAMALRGEAEDFSILKEIFVDDIYRIGAIDGPLQTVVDLGANAGLFALRVAPIAGRVICAEPVEANLQIARRNVARIHAAGKVTFCKCAVAGESGRTARIFLSTGNTGGHSVRREHAAQWQAGGYEDVPTLSLADLFHRQRVEHCSLLKCDVEGSEFEIFDAAPTEILARIDRIAMEVHLTAAGWDPDRLGRLCDKLESAGLRVGHEPVRDRRGRLKPGILLFAVRDGEPHARKAAA